MKHLEVVLDEINYLTIGRLEGGYWAHIQYIKEGRDKVFAETLTDLEDKIIDRVEGRLYNAN